MPFTTINDRQNTDSLHITDESGQYFVTKCIGITLRAIRNVSWLTKIQRSSASDRKIINK